MTCASEGARIPSKAQEIRHTGLPHNSCASEGVPSKAQENTHLPSAQLLRQRGGSIQGTRDPHTSLSHNSCASNVFSIKKATNGRLNISNLTSHISHLLRVFLPENRDLQVFSWIFFQVFHELVQTFRCVGQVVVQLFIVDKLAK
ncbi:hypothetical protein SAMN05421877_10954 [Sphingobacterium lactis]|uniref:Uncharacterized protein n=1 Tax=Sphingobacterium lactis TaxID=797291 RepID=A0A1H6B022_9SPHI|nr:hypothetical protein SAMN05421877_10954 [Sphingobacterium lactis]